MAPLAGGMIPVGTMSDNAPASAACHPAILYCGDALAVLKTLAAESVQCIVTSPPYWGLRDYATAGQYGLEGTPEGYVQNMVDVFAWARRALRRDGTLWLNMGDSYGRAPEKGGSGPNGKHDFIPDYGAARKQLAESARCGSSDGTVGRADRPGTRAGSVKPKDLVGVPWRLAFALQADGWWLRSDIIWSKPNPMPESVTDRPTKSHEYVFLLSKSERYYYDAAAIAEAISRNTHARLSQDVMAQVGSFRANGGGKTNGPMRAVGRNPGVNPKAAQGVVGHEKQNASFAEAVSMPVSERNARTVWEIPTQSFTGAHFATFPEELARRCILAGSRPGDTVLDPFGGSGTVAQVATGNGRAAIYIDLNPKYVELARQRIGPLLCADACVGPA